MKTLNYLYGGIEEIKIGQKYYFGQLCEGDEDVEELLESEAIAVYDDDGEEIVCDFEVIEKSENIFDTIVKVTDIR